ncbi:hypothetical protein [Paenibacillus sp. NPDC058177]|uniref:hypothetical protein n=1 Tax=Paenibacillus sp. NPDC058177 TaxID=3346369 RepID=UPI0036DE6CF0
MSSSGIRVWGNTQLAPERIVEAGTNDELIISVNGTDFPITLDAGTYSTSHTHVTSLFVAHVNDKLVEADCPVKAKVGGIHDDVPRTVLIFEALNINEGVTMEISGTGATEFIGDDPYEVQQPQIELVSSYSDTMSQIDIRKNFLVGRMAVWGRAQVDLSGSVLTQRR